MYYTLTAPMMITSELVPGVMIGDTRLSVDPKWANGEGTRVAWSLTTDGRTLYSGEMLVKPCEPEDVPLICAAVMCSFFSAAAEARPDGENADLFPPDVMQWARDHSSEIDEVHFELSEQRALLEESRLD